MADDEFVLSEAEVYEVIPDGEILGAEVVTCEVRETPFDDKFNPGQKQKEVSFRFLITEEGDWNGSTVFGRTPTTFSTHPDCKLRVWVQEILGQDELGEGFRFKPSALEGMPVRVNVNVRERKGADGTPVLKNYVGDVISARSKSSAANSF